MGTAFFDRHILNFPYAELEHQVHVSTDVLDDSLRITSRKVATAAWGMLGYSVLLSFGGLECL